MIIGISGKKRAGKDTAASILLDRGFRRVSFAAPLKSICGEVFGLDFNDDSRKDEPFDTPLDVSAAHINKLTKRIRDEVTEEQEEAIRAAMKFKKFGTRREILQFIGTDLFRKFIDDNIWINYAKQELLDHEGDIVITDARFPNERKMLKELGAKLILIKRPEIEDTTDSHSSENSLGTDADYDVVLNNVGTIEDLHEAVMFSIMPKQTTILSEADFAKVEQGLADAAAGKLKKIDLNKSDWIEE